MPYSCNLDLDKEHITHYKILSENYNPSQVTFRI